MFGLLQGLKIAFRIAASKESDDRENKFLMFHGFLDSGPVDIGRRWPVKSHTLMPIFE